MSFRNYSHLLLVCVATIGFSGRVFADKHPEDSPEKKKQVNTEAPPDDDLFCLSKDVLDAGYSVVANVNRDSSLDARIATINGWGPSTELFKGKLFLFDAKFNGKKVFELRDREVNPTTVIRLVPKGDDQIVMIAGKKMEGVAYTKINCRVADNLASVLK